MAQVFTEGEEGAKSSSEIRCDPCWLAHASECRLPWALCFFHVDAKGGLYAPSSLSDTPNPFQVTGQNFGEASFWIPSLLVLTKTRLLFYPESK